MTKRENAESVHSDARGRDREIGRSRDSDTREHSKDSREKEWERDRHSRAINSSKVGRDSAYESHRRQDRRDMPKDREREKASTDRERNPVTPPPTLSTITKLGDRSRRDYMRPLERVSRDYSIKGSFTPPHSIRIEKLPIERNDEKKVDENLNSSNRNSTLAEGDVVNMDMEMEIDSDEEESIKALKGVQETATQQQKLVPQQAHAPQINMWVQDKLPASALQIDTYIPPVITPTFGVTYPIVIADKRKYGPNMTPFNSTPKSPVNVPQKTPSASISPQIDKTKRDTAVRNILRIPHCID